MRQGRIWERIPSIIVLIPQAISSAV